MSACRLAGRSKPRPGVQAQAIEAACAARDWAFIGGVRKAEPVNGKGHQRPGLTHAIERLEGGEADCLIVTELARPVFEDD
jgi:DNA invertase Pin-like site-specific DNA recombinase